MKLSGIFVLALLAAAVVAQKAPVESLEQIKFKIVISKMAQEPMFESVGFLKLIKIAKKIAPLVVRDNQSFDEINWKIVITKLAQENQEMVPRRDVPIKEDPEFIKIHIVIGKMAQEPKFEQLSFGKVIKIAKKLAPLVLEKNTETIDQLKWKIIISKMSVEQESFKPVLPKILRSEANEQGAKEVIKKIINGIIHFIVKSEEPLEDWKIIISKMSEQLESAEPVDELKWKIIISKLSEDLESSSAEAPEQGAKEVIKKIINGIIHFIVKSEEPLEEWKIIISKLSEEIETEEPFRFIPGIVRPKRRDIPSLKADAPEHNIITKILKKVIINGVIHWINTRSTLETVGPKALSAAEPLDQSAKDVIKKIINGIIHFIVKADN